MRIRQAAVVAATAMIVGACSSEATTTGSPSASPAADQAKYRDQCAFMHQANSEADASFTGSPDDKAEQYIAYAEAFGGEQIAQLTASQRAQYQRAVHDYFLGRC